uniref:Uncharacterized protein n=1 Tax=Anguilla anguilla TaxID=7936 RepID=A0A0E9PSX1_ANGAN
MTPRLTAEAFFKVQFAHVSTFGRRGENVRVVFLQWCTVAWSFSEEVKATRSQFQICRPLRP